MCSSELDRLTSPCSIVLLLRIVLNCFPFSIWWWIEGLLAQPFAGVSHHVACCRDFSMYLPSHTRTDEWNTSTHASAPEMVFRSIAPLPCAFQCHRALVVALLSDTIPLLCHLAQFPALPFSNSPFGDIWQLSLHCHLARSLASCDVFWRVLWHLVTYSGAFFGIV
jgi:hypothetical protein